MLDPQRKDVVRETLDAYIAKFFNTDAYVERWSEWLLTESPSLAPIATFLRLRTEIVT